MKNTKEQGGQPQQSQPEVRSISRREFGRQYGRGVIAGAVGALLTQDLIATAQISETQLQNEVREELKKQGTLPPNERFNQPTWQKLYEEQYGKGAPLTPLEERQIASEQRAIENYTRNYNTNVADKVDKKQFFNALRMGGDITGIFFDALISTVNYFGLAGKK